MKKIIVGTGTITLKGVKGYHPKKLMSRNIGNGRDDDN